MLIDLYHALPQWARVLAASAYGYHLYSWRYGRDTEDLVCEALAREYWTAEHMHAEQSAQLSALLVHSAKNVPYYRGIWEQRRRDGDTSPVDVLANWPVLEKDPVRESPESFLVEGSNPKKLFRTATSGTTGKPLQLWQSRKTLHEWYALTEARWRRWYGVTKDDRWAILGGQLIVPVSQTEPPFWIWNRAFRQLYMSSYHLSPDLIRHYFTALKKYRIKYVYGYSSALYALASQALADGRDDLVFAVAITNAEPLSARQRQTISQAFHCPVRETYGMSEMVAAASECEYGRLHLWPRVGVVEVLTDGKPAAPETTGDLVCTGLLNTDMPLIRYRVGDRAALGDRANVCECGRTLPWLKSVEGRLDDVLYTASGRRVGRLDPVLKSDLAVQEVQIVQKSLTELHVNVVPAKSFNGSTEAAIARQLRNRMGEVDVVIKQMSFIPRGANGKFRAVICELDQDEIRRSTGTSEAELGAAR
ncbi:MAG TPA: AMP-binding protein [Bryobacteraceae bacterium]|nr:AMP-binding protein [Bryobacteraceae bacterium]